MAFASRTSRIGIEQDRMIAYAIIYSIQIIGEVASRLSPETRSALPTIPWRDITDMRNRIVDAYQEIDFDIIWSTVRDDVSQPAAILATVLAAEPPLEELE